MTRFLIILGLCITTSILSQTTEFSGYDWNTFPSMPESDTVKPVNGILITLERRITEVYLNKDDIFEEIMVFHRKVRVGTHDAVNSYNKIYVPVGNVIEVLGVKARYIAPNGKITEVPRESIRQIDNLENKGDFQTFAIEGAEAGGEIEYYYKLRRKYNPYGSVTIQSDEPRLNVQIIYKCPPELDYTFKSYNGFPEFISGIDTVKRSKYIKAFADYIPAISEERYAAYDVNMMQYVFTLSHNNFGGPLRVYSFSKVSNNMYSSLYVTTKTEDAAIKSAIKKLPIAKTEFEKIRSLENWLKSEMVVSEELPGTPAIDVMLKNKVTTKFGMTRLFVNCLQKMNVDFETVLTCEQSEKRFDPEFNGWNYLDDFIISFPQYSAVILPDNLSYRAGLIPSGYQSAYGLFLHPVAYNDELKTLAYEIRKLPADNYLRNTDSLLINLKINTGQMNMEAEIQRKFSGELASTFQAYWDLMTQERKDEMVETYFSMGNQNTAIASYELTNTLPSDIGVKPLIWNVKLTANSLIEQAGEELLVKIGETIGEQAEMYQPTKRKLPVYVGSLHSYYRKIEFEIPEGYKVSNPENLNMKVEMVHNNRVSSAFTSDYEIKGNKLIIHSREFYSELEYPKEEFDAFRDVINAAADFNKKTILLTKN